MFNPARYFQIDNFLSVQEHVNLLDYVLSNERNFTASTTSTRVSDYRRSWVLYDCPQISAVIVDRTLALLPQLWQPLGVAPFEVGDIEAQITAHNHGCYYRIHNDNNSDAVRSRTLTYVYYFHREPKAFEGGELRIYDMHGAKPAASYSTIYPRNNSIVLFASHIQHEVRPVQCESRSFSDSRFTLNGWVRSQF